MEKSVSSLKIFNIVICIIILVTFCIIGTRVNVHAYENSTSSDEVLTSYSK